MRHTIGPALAAVALTAALVWPQSPALADTSSNTLGAPSNATFGIQPSGPKGPDGRGYFAIGATPGARANDHVAIQNYSRRPLTLTVAATDGVNTPQGDFALLPSTKRSTDVGTWIHFPASMRKVTVPGRSLVVVPFRIVVPRTATPGDHAGGITATLRAVVKSKSGQRFHLLQTVGSRVFIRVSGPLHPALTLKEIGARYQGAITSVGTGTTLVTYTIRNSGNVALGGHELLSISGLLGLKTSSGSAPNLQLLLPGYSVTQSVEVPGVVPQVWMNAHVSVSPLILPGTVQKLPDAYTGSAHFWAIPWWVLAVLLIGFAAFGVWWRRRHRGPKEPPKDERPSDPAQTQGSDTELEPDVVTVPERTEPEPVTVPDRTKPEPAAVPRSEPIRIPTYDADFPSGAGIDR